MSEYAIVAPEDFDQSVFRLIGKEWMLVTAKNQEGKVNTMTASWGGLGVMWGKNVAVTVLRPQRYTKEFIDQSESFTLSFYDDTFKKDLSYLGSVSGRDEDKIKEAGVHVAYHDGVPYIDEGKEILLCRVMSETPITQDEFKDEKIDAAWYADQDYHKMYIAEITDILAR